MMGLEYLEHYGTPRHSGRYPYGSGDNPYQRDGQFHQYVIEMKNQGMTEKEIAEMNNMTTNQLRQEAAIASAKQKAANYATINRLKEKGYSPAAISERTNIPIRTVYNYLNPTKKDKINKHQNIVNILKDKIDSGSIIDIGVGSESYIGVSRTQLKNAVRELENEGYSKYTLQIKQPFSNNFTPVLVLAPPDTSLKEVYDSKDKISVIGAFTEDGGRSVLGIKPPKSVDSKRIDICYAEQGGTDKDGIIELRRGTPDLDLGESKYSQVRILVDDNKFLKGIAIYSDDLPPGIDIRFNTNKSQSEGKSNVMKNITDEPDNPFKSTVRQKYYIDENGKEQLSALNIVGIKEGSGEEGSWGEWSRNISSQVLSKQTPTLAKKQLNLEYDIRKTEFDDIMKLTNPAVKKKLLETFSDEVDSQSIHLKAAALPRQQNQLILPIPSIREGQVFAPNFNNGEKVVLIRHPHGGIFEIPELTVNNKNPIAKKVIGTDAKDAIGINPATAQQLSGADFDGDTVIVIPQSSNKSMQIKTSKPLKSLIDFDPRDQYKAVEGMKHMKESYKQTEMGVVSNLITDMTIKGATNSEIARAVRYSMVVIDAVKHDLNYQQAYIDNNIIDLKRKYQNSSRGGASTLVSRAKSPVDVDPRKAGQLIGPVSERTGRPTKVYIDPSTGEKLYTSMPETYTKKDGTTVRKLMKPKPTKMGEVKDAYELSSGTDIENVYADYANKMKSLANEARKAMVSIERTPVNKSAKGVYKDEIKSLTSKLAVAKSNKPLERQAQIYQEMIVKAKKANNPNLTDEDVKKIKVQALAEGRSRSGSDRQAIDITPREWQAIQSGAISQNIQSEILNNIKDLTQLKQYATPKSSKTVMTASKIAKAKSLLAAGYTQAEVASMLGVSASTIMKAIK